MAGNQQYHSGTFAPVAKTDKAGHGEHISKVDVNRDDTQGTQDTFQTFPGPVQEAPEGGPTSIGTEDPVQDLMPDDRPQLSPGSPVQEAPEGGPTSIGTEERQRAEPYSNGAIQPKKWTQMTLH